MLTLIVQAFVADFMAHTVAPAVSRAVVKVVPAAPPLAVQEVVDQLFSPTAYRSSEGAQKAWLSALTGTTSGKLQR